jgi:RHS repeat-associated protein
MSGKPAARLGDATLKGGPIVQGSRTVLIGSQGGVACSECPGGVAVGSPVNPSLGAKVLGNETDFMLPGPMPLAWSRSYSSFISPDGGEDASVGLLGPGWHLPTALRLAVDFSSVKLFDSKGRVITFLEPLTAGGYLDSPSERIALYRPREYTAQTRPSHSDLVADLKTSHGESTAKDIARRVRSVQSFGWDISERIVLAWSYGGDQLWVFAQSKHDARNWPMVAIVDRFGRALQHCFDAYANLIGFIDGAGRHYRLRHISLDHANESVDINAPIDALQPHQLTQTPWGWDTRLRLAAIDLQVDPHDLTVSADAPRTLVRYRYHANGDLAAVLNETGRTVREFETYQGMMLAHRYAGRAPTRYRYETSESPSNEATIRPLPGARVLVQENEGQGLTYFFDYRDTIDPETRRKDSRETRVTDNLGRVEIYRFSGERGLKRVAEHVRADGSILKSEHDGHGRLTATIDALGRRTLYQLDASGAVMGVQSPGGIRTSSERDPVTGRLVAHIAPDGARTAYRYDDHGRLLEAIAPDHSRTAYSYADGAADFPQNDIPVTITDASGKDKHLQWNALEQLIAYTDCSNRTTRYAYHRSGALERIVNAADQITRHDYDHESRRIASYYPDGKNEHYRYDSEGRLLDHTDAAGVQTSYAYDARARLLGVTRAGLSLGYKWDAADRLVTLQNENLANTEFRYDVMDRLIEEIGFDGRALGYAYDAAGQLIASSELGSTHEAAHGHTARETHYHYDLAGRLIERIIPATAHAPDYHDNFEYDIAGRITGIQRHQVVNLANGKSGATATDIPHSSILFTHDVLGRLTGETQRLYRDDGSVFEHSMAHRYDVLGNRIETDLPELGVLAYLRYGSGHVHGLSLSGETLVDFERDSLHRERARRFAGLEIARQLDPMGRLIEQRWLETATQSPEVGQDRPAVKTQGPALPDLPVKIATLGSLNLRLDYDGSGQLIAEHRGQAHTPELTSTHYAYDQAQRLIGWKNGGDQTSYLYDPAGNRLPSLNAKTSALPGRDGTDRDAQWSSRVQSNLGNQHFNLLAHERDPSHPDSGFIERWPRNRVDFDDTYRYKYDPFGNLIERISQTVHASLPKSIQEAFGYDGEHRLVSYKKTINTEIHTEAQYTYDALGRRLRKTVSEIGSKKKALSQIKADDNCYGWDGDRLVYADSNAERIYTIYEPDSFVPLVRIKKPAEPDALSNEVQAAKELGALFRSDSETSKSYAASSDDSSAVTNLSHDQWRAMRKMMSDIAHHGLPESAKRMIAASGIEPKQIEKTIQATQYQAHQQKKAKAEHVHLYYCNHLGTPIALINQATKQIDWSIELDPWGNVLKEYQRDTEVPINQPIRMQGQQLDRESDLFYNRYRYYDSQLGRYITQDPVGLKGGINFYAYADGRTTAMVDAFGLKGWYCQRPLGKKPGTRGPIVLNHQYLCVTRPDGTISCGGLTTSGNAVFSASRLTTPQEDFYDATSCQEVDDDKDSCYEDCVAKGLQTPAADLPTYGIGPQATDCQEFADDLHDKCKKQCKPKKKWWPW